jgi:CubicO group peptidase (beta-lactamase class C family)
MNNRHVLITEINQYLTAQSIAANFYGSILVADKEGVLISDSYGMAVLEHNVMNTPKTKFRIGSLTKQFTAAAILQLVGRGLCNLDSKLNNYINDYPNGELISIHHLLSNTSGIQNFTSFLDYMNWSIKPATITENIERFKNKPLNFIPGDQFEYSNSNYVLLTFIIEQVCGCSYEEYLINNIFDLLDMKDSGYDDHSRIIENRASGYYLEDQVIKNCPYIDMTLPQGAGGLFSTIEDLHKWDRALYRDEILTADLKRKMFTPVKDNYAYGWTKQNDGTRDLLCHEGGINGFSSIIVRFVDEQICIIILCNYSQPIGEIAVNVSKLIFK